MSKLEEKHPYWAYFGTEPNPVLHAPIKPNCSSPLYHIWKISNTGYRHYAKKISELDEKHPWLPHFGTAKIYKCISWAPSPHGTSSLYQVWRQSVQACLRNHSWWADRCLDGRKLLILRSPSSETWWGMMSSLSVPSCQTWTCTCTLTAPPWKIIITIKVIFTYSSIILITVE